MIRFSIILALLACVSGCATSSPARDATVKQYQDAELEEILDTKKVSTSFTETPFCCIITFLKDLTEIDFVFDIDFVHNPNRKTTFITLRLDSMTMREALNSITKLSDTKWTVRYGAVLIQDAKVYKKQGKKSPNKRIKTDQ